MFIVEVLIEHLLCPARCQSLGIQDGQVGTGPWINFWATASERPQCIGKCMLARVLRGVTGPLGLEWKHQEDFLERSGMRIFVLL